MTILAADQAQKLLRYSFGIGAIVIGLDKFFNFVTDWSKYVSEPLASGIPVSVPTLLMIVGVIEIIVGVLVLSEWTRVGAYLLAVWFALIIINLSLVGGYGDIMLRDALLGLSSIALAELSPVPLRRRIVAPA